MEVLSVLVVISLVLIIVVRNFNMTASLGREESYKIMKRNIVSASKDYINECQAKTIECDINLKENNQFPAKILKEKGYFKNLKSPLDGKNLEDCLIIEVKIENSVIVTNLQDNCYQ